VRTTARDRNTGAVEIAARRAGNNLGILDRQLARHPFIVGDQLSIADIAVGTMMYRYFNLPLARPALPNVEAWYDRLSQRAAYRTHVMIDFKPMFVPGA